MSPELDNDLCTRYPKIFADRNASPRETAMCWGFECDDGWFNIIDNLCGCIQRHIDISEEQRDYALRNNLEVKDACPQVVAFQVKEKFGGLRFYFSGGNDIIHGMVTLAEAMSYSTCEVCGNPGKPRGGSYIRALCDIHAKESGIE